MPMNWRIGYIDNWRDSAVSAVTNDDRNLLMNGRAEGARSGPEGDIVIEADNAARSARLDVSKWHEAEPPMHAVGKFRLPTRIILSLDLASLKGKSPMNIAVGTDPDLARSLQ